MRYESVDASLVLSLRLASSAGHIEPPLSRNERAVLYRCRAIRKLAAVATPEESSMTLSRGVRGMLPRGFFNPDDQGMAVAVDMAFMSTSRKRTVPINYMDSKGPNVLWELQPRVESDAGFHYGADISKLSQFTAEQEVLFPPCTALMVQLRPGWDTPSQVDGKTDELKVVRQKSTPGPDDFARTKCDEAGKSFLSVAVLPFFT